MSQCCDRFAGQADHQSSPHAERRLCRCGLFSAGTPPTLNRRQQPAPAGSALREYMSGTKTFGSGSGLAAGAAVHAEPRSTRHRELVQAVAVALSQQDAIASVVDKFDRVLLVEEPASGRKPGDAALLSDPIKARSRGLSPQRLAGVSSWPFIF